MWSSRAIASQSLAVLSLLHAGTAWAEGQASATSTELVETTASFDDRELIVTTEQMTLPPGRVRITVELAINLSKDLAAAPISLSPDVWIGVTDALTVGVVHSTRGALGVVGTTGDAVCLTGKAKGCTRVYDNVGLDARYQVRDARPGGVGVALDGGLLVNSFDPLQLALNVGGIGHGHVGPLALDVAPSLSIGLTERGAGNKELLALPVTVHYDVAPGLTVSAQTGLVTPLAKAGDLYTVPLSVGGDVAVGDRAFVGATLSLPALIGGSAIADGVEVRTFTLSGSYQL
jgi:hypothetical protein